MTSKSMMTLVPPSSPSSEPWVPRPIQRRGTRWLLERHPGAALLFDPGLGKTSCTLAAIKLLKAKGQRPKVLLIAPVRVMAMTWPDEIAKWTDFHGLTFTILHGPKKDDRLREDVDIYLINPEGLDWLLKPTVVRGKKRSSVGVDAARFKRFGFTILVIDELTAFKNHTSIRFKALKAVLRTFQRRWGLTASPAANYLEPLFGQVYVLDEGRALGQYVTHWRDQFFETDYNGFSYTAKEGAEEAIYARLAPLALRADAQDHLELPELVENVVRVPLPAVAQRIYQSLETYLLVQVNAKAITAKNAAVASSKCRQVASGALYLEPALGELLTRLPRRGQREWVELHTAKLEACAELLAELQGAPTIVAYEFTHDYERLQQYLGDPKRQRWLPHIGKGVGLAEGRVVQDRWNRGEIPVLLAHSNSIARGLNLQHSGNHVIWFTQTWDYEIYDQLIRRLLRQGSKHKRVFSHILAAVGTVDELVLSAIHAKRDCQNNFFKGLQAWQTRYQ